MMYSLFSTPAVESGSQDGGNAPAVTDHSEEPDIPAQHVETPLDTKKTQ